MPNGLRKPVEEAHLVVLGYRAKSRDEKSSPQDQGLVAFDDTLQADFERVIMEILDHRKDEEESRCASTGR